MNNVKELKRLIELLRKHKESGQLSNNKVFGLTKNIIGELKHILSFLEGPNSESYKVSKKIESIVHDYEHDPVISAYLKTKSEWEEKIQELKLEISMLSNEDYI